MKKIIITTISVIIPLTIFIACPGPTPPSSPDAGQYHTYAEIVTEMQALQDEYPMIARVSILGQSIEQRNILAIKISDNVATDEEEPELLFVGGHHAREWISVDVPFLLAKYLLKNYATDNRIKNLVDNGEIWIVPMLNPDGHQYTVTTDRLWRKNRRNNGDGSYGVDLNRNYGYQWGGPGSSGDTYSETYRGTEAFSEPETQILRELMASHHFKSMISYHSFSQLVLYPWGYTSAAAPDKALMQQMANTIASDILAVHGKRYTAEQSATLYLASGDATDWLYGTTTVPSFTIELRPTSSNPGFQLPESEIQPTFEENLPAALYLIDWSETSGSN